MAVGLADLGENVEILTPHFDTGRCFDELREPRKGLLVSHFVWVDKLLPREVAGHCQAAMAALRCAVIAVLLVLRELYKTKTGRHDELVDLVVCDIVTLPVLVIGCFSRIPTLFYCHYPDKLLTKSLQRQSSAPDINSEGFGRRLRSIYRVGIDWLEEEGIRKASKVVVNSKFTAHAFRTAFARAVGESGIEPEVLYPAVSLPARAQTAPLTSAKDMKRFLSINRFEEKKNISLAIESFALVAADSPGEIELVIAGGCDPRLTENAEVLGSLQALAEKLGVSERVHFMTNISIEERDNLLRSCTCLLYTPSDEHFGIVPLEAMSFGRPVIACRSGGPLETVVDGETGFLCQPEPRAFAQKMRLLADGEQDLGSKFGQAGRDRVETAFSSSALAVRTRAIARSLARQRSPAPPRVSSD